MKDRIIKATYDVIFRIKNTGGDSDHDFLYKCDTDTIRVDFLNQQIEKPHIRCIYFVPKNQSMSSKEIMLGGPEVIQQLNRERASMMIANNLVTDFSLN